MVFIISYTAPKVSKGTAIRSTLEEAVLFCRGAKRKSNIKSIDFNGQEVREVVMAAAYPK